MSAICNDARWQQAMKVVANFQCCLQCCFGVIYISDYECSFAVIQVVMSFASSSNHMQASQYTFKIVQVCTPEPCKLFLMSNKRKCRLLCMRKSTAPLLLSSVLPSLLSICCKQACNSVIVLSGLDRLVKLGGLDTSLPQVAAISLAQCCKALNVQGAGCS